MKSKQSYILNRSITTMLIAVMLLFVAAVFGTMKTYAAEGAVKAEGRVPVSWRIMDSGVLEIGDRNEAQSCNIALQRVPGALTEYDYDYQDAMSAEEKRAFWGYLEVALASAKKNWPWLDSEHINDIKNIRVIGDIRIEGSMQAMFAGIPNVESITGLENIITDDVVDMSNVFFQNSATNITGYEGWNTRKVKSISGIFREAHVQRIDMSRFNLESLINMEDICSRSTSLKSVKMGYNTNKVTTMEAMFLKCSVLTEVKFSKNFSTESTVNMMGMFSECSALEKIDLSGFNTGNLLNMYAMFYKCGKLKSIDGIENFDTSKVSSFNGTFTQCENLETVGVILLDTSAATSTTNMYYGCTKLIEATNQFIEDKRDQYSSVTITELEKAADAVSIAVNNVKTGDAALEISKEVNGAKGFVTAEEDKEAADTAVTEAENAENQAKAAKDEIEKAKAEEPQDLDKIKDAQEKYDEKAKAAEDAVKAAEEAVAKATASAEKTGNDTIKGNAQAVADALDSVKKAAEDRTADDEVVAAIEDAEKAAKEAARLKEIADNLAKTNPGSDEAIKAAEAANKAAAVAQDAANKAVEIANAKGSQERKDAANAAKQNADKAKVEAAKLEAEQKQIKADNLLASNPNSQEAIAAGQAALDAANAYKKDAEAAYGAGSAEANAAQQQVNKATETNNKIVAANDVKPGDQFVFNNQKYEVLTVPANGNGTAALVKGKNAKSVTVPKTASYTEKGKTFDVTEINTKAFYKKTRKVTVGANVDTIDKQAFKGSKVATVVLKTKDLTKKSVKGSLKGSKVKTVQVKVGSKKVNKKYVKKYKKIFTKKNAGKKVTVK